MLTSLWGRNQKNHCVQTYYLMKPVGKITYAEEQWEKHKLFDDVSSAFPKHFLENFFTHIVIMCRAWNASLWILHNIANLQRKWGTLGVDTLYSHLLWGFNWIFNVLFFLFIYEWVFVFCTWSAKVFFF